VVTRELSVDGENNNQTGVNKKVDKGIMSELIWLRKRTSSFSKVATNFLGRNLPAKRFAASDALVNINQSFLVAA
jgi:hypothetical protein